ncbi:MAG TPA: maltotransferase domain-containing protein [Gammaproteobacteria bacterium]|nr:maltotransferase domain-containing protein [Gammaproteobacteria bacterium]
MDAAGPRIYNLFPLLIGPVSAWRAQLPRIAALNFNWVYVNAFHYPGFSGSLYAIKDPYRLHDLFAAGGETGKALREFTAAAEDAGLRVIADLVVNHTARDALLADEHPDWYRRELDGDFYSPRVADPGNPDGITVWGDLAELDYEHPQAREGLIDYWSRYLGYYIGLGFQGFRCDAAYKVPAAVWERLIAAGRAADPEVAFFAETLGCAPQDIGALGEAGFDYFFNSSKWWDFRADWLLAQYERLRRLGPSIAFPESHDTARLAAETAAADDDQLCRLYKLRYLFAACFSTGVMMPVGYEYAFRRPLDVVSTRPADWEDTGVDLSEYVAAVNALKASLPVLNEEGPQRRITAPHAPLTGLARRGSGGDRALLLINPDAERSHAIDGGSIVAAGEGDCEPLVDVTPECASTNPTPGRELVLEPLQARLFYGHAIGHRSGGARRRGLARLKQLAGERVVIENVWPEIDGGRHPVKRVIGDTLEVWADIFSDGHDALAACVRWRGPDGSQWREVSLEYDDNDRWCGTLPLASIGRYTYTIEAWRDGFATWRSDFIKKRDAGQPVALELEEGRECLARAATHAQGRDAEELAVLIAAVDAADEPEQRERLLLDAALPALMRRAAPRSNCTRYRRELEVVVDRVAARFGAWYEIFPRSLGKNGAHGSFDDLIAHLPYVREMGFDVLYLPPIHPVGTSHRKGRNNSLSAAPADPGSPWAIGSAEGGHTAIHPALGTPADFQRLLAAAREHELEIALDFAIQCSRDHPWIKEHPEWFDWRPDGTIKFAENPPKQYQDIVNVHFYGDAFPALWLELRDVVVFWVERGVRIFRVDNPHTKPVPFWEWMIAEVQARFPDVIFLSEAFTRPKMLRKLAKAGFTQSYTYFTWRNTKQELADYLTELTQDVCKEYLRPNFFVNTPDINPPILQTGGRAAFQMRAVLAATLSSVWGIYSGFELCEATPIPGREEYLDSEKYQLKRRDYDAPGNIRNYIARINRVRRDNPALQTLTNLRFYPAYDDNILFYGKMTPTRDNIIWIAANLDPHNAHEADIELPLYEAGFADDAELDVESLLDGDRFRWRGRRQHIRLDPGFNPCVIWRVAPQGAGSR